MPLELIFTSVPKGVKPGSTGYCTVAKHKGIDRLLDQAVEKMCYYELMNHAAKPVVHTYRTLLLNTGTFHVLTRTCFSGSDHTGRTNYLSHNLIFEEAEALALRVSPAEIFLNASGWLSVWPHGQPPALMDDGMGKVTLPQPSADHSSLQTWQRIAGKGNLAHELGGYDQWKFITEGGEHLRTLSLLAEFASLGQNNLQLSWSQLTFATFLQPSEDANNFKIVGGDPSVPAFAALTRSTLDVRPSSSPEKCFSVSGEPSFGALPELNQPVVPTAGKPTEQEPLHGEVSSKDEGTVIQHSQEQSFHPQTHVPITPRQSNLNLGTPSMPAGPSVPQDIPDVAGKHPSKNKKTALVLSLVGVGVLTFGVVTAVLFWPEKKNRQEVSQAGEDNSVQGGGSGNGQGANGPSSDLDGDESAVSPGSSGEKNGTDENEKEKTDSEREGLLAKLQKLSQRSQKQLVEESTKEELTASLEALKKVVLEIEGKSIQVDLKEAKELLANLKSRLDEIISMEKKKEEAKKTKLPGDLILPSEVFEDSVEILLGEPEEPELSYVWNGDKIIQKKDIEYPVVYWKKGKIIHLHKDRIYLVKLKDVGRISNREEPGRTFEPGTPIEPPSPPSKYFESYVPPNLKISGCEITFEKNQGIFMYTIRNHQNEPIDGNSVLEDLIEISEKLRADLKRLKSGHDMSLPKIKPIGLLDEKNHLKKPLASPILDWIGNIKWDSAKKGDKTLPKEWRGILGPQINEIFDEQNCKLWEKDELIGELEKGFRSKWQEDQANLRKKTRKALDLAKDNFEEHEGKNPLKDQELEDKEERAKEAWIQANLYAKNEAEKFKAKYETSREYEKFQSIIEEELKNLINFRNFLRKHEHESWESLAKSLESYEEQLKTLQTDPKLPIFWKKDGKTVLKIIE